MKISWSLGDDAAIINSSKEILVSSDMLVEEYI